MWGHKSQDQMKGFELMLTQVVLSCIIFFRAASREEQHSVYKSVHVGRNFGSVFNKDVCL